MRKERIWEIAKRAAAVFFTWTAIGIGIYGICIWRLDLLIMAAVWYFIGGGLTMQSIRDLEKATRGEGDFRK